MGGRHARRRSFRGIAAYRSEETAVVGFLDDTSEAVHAGRDVGPDRLLRHCILAIAYELVSVPCRCAEFLWPTSDFMMTGNTGRRSISWRTGPRNATARTAGICPPYQTRMGAALCPLEAPADGRALRDEADRRRQTLSGKPQVPGHGYR